ncbi:hypothetical protein ACCO45_012994 [Purpureocillium lilacinum]|uniref:Uncharacterized protein n=1 Tax=Purpureocillium lilacinum TaxID=33203 RepID=A0ACC4DC42_PURLI
MVSLDGRSARHPLCASYTPVPETSAESNMHLSCILGLGMAVLAAAAPHDGARRAAEVNRVRQSGDSTTTMKSTRSKVDKRLLPGTLDCSDARGATAAETCGAACSNWDEVVWNASRCASTSDLAHDLRKYCMCLPVCVQPRCDATEGQEQDHSVGDGKTT